MANQIVLLTISYPKLPFHVACGDARALVSSLAKNFPKISFSREETGNTVIVKADITGQADPLLSERHLRAWAQGFMASASLWER